MRHHTGHRARTVHFAYPAGPEGTKTLVETDVPAIEKELERLGAPCTPGRVPRA